MAFLLALAVLIVIHEYGHYRVAVACGVKVLRFSVGFGKVLWRWQPRPGGTEFVVCALPLGGYVSMLDEREAPVAPQERHRAFNNQALWRRTAIVAAGPLANLLLAVLLFAAVHWIGSEEPKAVLAWPTAGSVAEQAGVRSSQWVREVSHDGVTWSPVRSMSDLQWQLAQATLRPAPLHLRVTELSGTAERTLVLDIPSLANRQVDAGLMQRLGVGLWFEPVIGPVQPGPAATAGVQAGDRVLRVDDVPVLDAAHLTHLIRAHGVEGVATPMVWHVQRGLQTLRFEFSPAIDPTTQTARAMVQLGANAERVLVRYGLVEGLQAAVQDTWERAGMNLQMLGRMLVGTESVKNLSGALTMADFAGQAVRLGITPFLLYLASISVGLGVLNLLPVPILDGGHLMYYLFEALTGRPVSGPWLERLQRGGMVLLLMTMSLALFNDVTRLF